MEYARSVADGRVKDSTLFYFHRQAGDDHDLTTAEGARAAVIEASGIAASWRDIDAIVSLWNDPTTDRTFWERVWCNRLVQGSRQAFDAELWKRLAAPRAVEPGSLIVVGFDGSQFHDSTAVVATEVETGYQWLAGLWEKPFGITEWRVPAADVDACIHDLFDRFEVWRMYADPPYWESWVAAWAGEFGEDRVIEWWTNRNTQMSKALRSFKTAMDERSLRHDGDVRLTRHIGNARKFDLPQKDEDGRALYVIRKERPDSPLKIDAAVSATLSWEARTDAIASGATSEGHFQAMVLGGRA